MKVQTVLGPVEPESLGITLPHEHFSLDFSHFYRSPPEYLKDRFDDITLKNVGFIRQMPYCSLKNLEFYGIETNKAVLNDVYAFKKYGGGSIVENTTQGLNGNITLLRNISEKTNVNVIAGTGYYIADMQDSSTLTHTKETMYNHMIQELIVGFNGDPDVKAGFMGEIASVHPMHDFEKRVIQVVGEIQEQIGCGVSFHPHRTPSSPFEIMRVYLESGGRANKAVMSHLDRTLYDDNTLLEFSNFGCYCQFDLFGTEVSYYQLNPQSDMPSDAQRISKIHLLLHSGKADKILISHDIHTRHRLIDFGGHGYSHIINNVIPQMKAKGIAESDIDRITKKNPAEWLQYNLA